MSPQQPSTTSIPLAAHKARILSKGYICTEIKNTHQTICIYKALPSIHAKAPAVHALQN